MATENVFETDVLVIGGGLSGMFAAIKAREEGVKVTVVEKGYMGKAGAAIFASNICVFNPEWGHNLKEWMTQIAETGDYMNNPEWTEITLKESYDRYKELLSWGIQVPKGDDGELIKSHKGVLEAHRIEWRKALPVLRNIVEKSGAMILDRIMVTDLLKHEGKVVGAVGFHTRSGDFYVFKAKATVMCTGTGILGVGDRVTMSTYEGEAMAYRAGAEISGKEYSISGTGAFSYIGTGYDYYGDRDQGDVKISLEGKEIKAASPNMRYMMFIDKHVDSEGYKVNRYTMIPSVHQGRAPLFWNSDDATEEEISSGLKYWGHYDKAAVGLSGSGLYRAQIRFESYVGWALHCASGISSTDTEGGTSLPGLFAAGDGYNSRAVGAKYAHGGFGSRNATVIGTRAGRKAADYAMRSGEVTIDPTEVARLKNSAYAPLERKCGFDQDWVTMQLRTITYPYYIFFVKHGDRLKAALTLVEFVKNHLTPMIYANPSDAHGLRLAHEAKGRVLCIEMMLRASLFRTESRGVHYREDYPFRDDPNWLAEVKIKNNVDEMDLIKEPLPKSGWPDLSIPYEKRYPLEFLGEESLRHRR